jgi:ElaB/YqjD/DUF883 family membrane-anchored ribosome-binding protein
MEDPMTNDPTTTPNGEADMPKIARARAGGRANNGSESDAHPGMMGDGTEEQNLNQSGNPSARITEEEVQAAFAGGPEAKTKVAQAAKSVAAEARSLKDKADQYYGEASEMVDDRMSALTDRIGAMRDQVQQSADAARTWAMKQADAAKQTAQDKPMLVISVSAGVAMAVGLMAGFVIGRATADDY